MENRKMNKRLAVVLGHLLWLYLQEDLSQVLDPEAPVQSEL